MSFTPIETFPIPYECSNDPAPLLPESTPAEDYPINALPATMQNAALAVAEHVQAPLALAGQCVIGAAAYLAQTRVDAPHPVRPDGMPSSLFILTLADSGDRKSECRRLAFREIDEAEREARKNHGQQCADILERANELTNKKQRDEHLAENPLPRDPVTQYADVTFEPIAGAMIRGASAACWDTDEGGQLFGGAALKADTRSSTIGGLIRAFDSGTFERTRSRSNPESSGFAYDRRLSILVLAQPAAVAEALSDPLLKGQGFLPRFLFSSTESLAGSRFLTDKRMQENSYDDPRLRKFWERCRQIQAEPAHTVPETGEVKPLVLATTKEADEVWLNFYNDTEREQSRLGEFYAIRPFASRAGELARRLAAVFACFERMEAIEGEAMEQACRIVRHSLREWVRYAEEAQPSAELMQAAALVEWLTDPSRLDAWQSFHRNELGKSGPKMVRKAKHRDKLLELLVRYRHLTTDDNRHYEINARAEAADSAENPQHRPLASAQRVRESADVVQSGNYHEQPVPHAAKKPAKFRDESAAESECAVGLSAKSAQSATPGGDDMSQGDREEGRRQFQGAI